MLTTREYGGSSTSKNALDILAIPAMSAEVERVFSSTGQFITDRRNRRQDDIVEAVECLKSWLYHLIISLLLYHLFFSSSLYHSPPCRSSLSSFFNLWLYIFSLALLYPGHREYSERLPFPPLKVTIWLLQRQPKNSHEFVRSPKQLWVMIYSYLFASIGTTAERSP